MKRSKYYEVSMADIWTAMEHIEQKEPLTAGDSITVWVALEALRRDLRNEGCNKCTLPPAKECASVAETLGLSE